MPLNDRGISDYLLVWLDYYSSSSIVRDSSAVRRLFVGLAGAVGCQSALHKENSGFAAPTLGRHISTFRGYRILFSIRNPYINRFSNQQGISDKLKSATSWLSCCHLKFRKIWYCLIKTRIDLVSLSLFILMYICNKTITTVFCIGQYKFLWTLEINIHLSLKASVNIVFKVHKNLHWPQQKTIIVSYETSACALV